MATHLLSTESKSRFLVMSLLRDNTIKSLALEELREFLVKLRILFMVIKLLSTVAVPTGNDKVQIA